MATSDPSVELVGDPEPLGAQVENLGFLGLNKSEPKIRILSEGFTDANLPPSNASLFTIANKRGLFAAAGPSTFVLDSTSALRTAFANADTSYKPRLEAPSPFAITHVAFTANENHLVLGGSSGRIMVHSIEALSSGSQDQFEFSIEDQALREVKPNPMIPDLVAVLTMKGDVRMLDLTNRTFLENTDGSPVLKTGVSTIAWSKLGKQIMCGMGDGSGWQMTPQGEGKGVLPPPPEVSNHYVSSLVWLENHLFVTTHTPVPAEGSEENDSIFHILKREGSKFTYTRVMEPAPPYGQVNRVPPYFHHALLRQYAPSLHDLLIFSGTMATDIGMVARFSEEVAEIPQNTFMTVTPLDDTRRAGMPLSAEMSDTSPIGMVLDLSSTNNVRRPVGGEEIEESPGPLPILMVLTHEGVVVAWNIIYNDAILAKEKYNGMMMYSTEQQKTPPIPKAPETPAPTSPVATRPQLQSPFSQAPSANKPAANPFATAPTTSSTSTFGQQSGLASPFQQQSSTLGNGTAFGSVGTLGAKSSAWGSSTTSTTSAPALKPAFGPSTFGQPAAPTSALTSTPAFGQSSFGQTAAAKPAFGQSSFGQPSALGGSTGTAFGQQPKLGSNAAPAFGQAGKLGASAFGQASGLGGGSSTSSPFGSTTTSSGFGAYASKGGFGGAAAADGNTGGSVFGSGGGLSKSSGSVFGSGSSIGGTSTSSPFGGLAASSGDGGSVFGSGSGFKLGSTFKAEPSQAEGSNGTSASDGGSFGFGSSLGNMLGSSTSTPAISQPQQLQTTEEDMDDESPPSSASSSPKVTPARPAVQPSPFGAKTTTTTTASPFASTSNPFGKPNTPAGSSASVNPFGKPSTTSTTPNPFAASTSSTTAKTENPFAASPSPFATATSQSKVENPFGKPGASPSPFGTSPSKIPTLFGKSGAAASPSPFAQTPTKSAAATTKPLDTPTKIPAPKAADASPPPAPLPPSFTAAKKPAEKKPFTDAPLPPDPAAKPVAGGSNESIVTPIPSVPDSVGSSSPGTPANEDEAPLPPDFTSALKAKDPAVDAAAAPLPPQGQPLPDDDEEEEEEEDSADSDDFHQVTRSEAGSDSSPKNEKKPEGAVKTPSKPSTSSFFAATTPKAPDSAKSTKSTTSNIFGGGASYSSTFGEKTDKDSPFASFFNKAKTEEIESEDDEDEEDEEDVEDEEDEEDADDEEGEEGTEDEEDEEVRRPTRTSTTPSSKAQVSSKLPVMKGGLQARKTPDKKNLSVAGGRWLNAMAADKETPEVKVKKEPEEKPSGGLFGRASAPTSGLFGAKTEAGAAPPKTGGLFSSPAPTSGGFFGAKKPEDAKPKPSTAAGGIFVSPAPAKPPSAFGSPAPAAKQRLFSPTTQQRTGSPFGATPTPLSKPGTPASASKTASPAPQVKAEPRESPKLEVPEDEKMREFIHNTPIKPVYELPQMRKLEYGDVPEDFASLFDALYISGNKMLNTVGLISRDLQAYLKSQSLPSNPSNPDPLSSATTLTTTISTLSTSIPVLPENAQQQLSTATRTHIKLSTQLSELQRLMARHTDPESSAASSSSARILPPEHQLAQRTLRTRFSRTEKKLKDLESLAMELQARCAKRDQNARVKRPTLAAVQRTVEKMLERAKEREERVRRLREKARRARARTGTPARESTMTPTRDPTTPLRYNRERSSTPTPAPRREIEVRGTPTRGGFVTPVKQRRPAPVTPVLAVLESEEVEDVGEMRRRRRENGGKLRRALEKRGERVAGGAEA